MSYREILIFVEDFNATVGETVSDRHLKNVVGNYGMCVTNERGEMRIDFCPECQPSIANFYFQYHINQKNMVNFH